MKIVFSILFLLSINISYTQEKEDLEVQNPYKSIEILIGTWTLDFGKGEAIMDFE